MGSERLVNASSSVIDSILSAVKTHIGIVIVVRIYGVVYSTRNGK